MKTHWRAFPQQGVKRDGVEVPMSMHYLFNNEGLYLGYVQKLSWGEWRASAGRPAVEIGDFPNLEDAKKAIERTIRE